MNQDDTINKDNAPGIMLALADHIEGNPQARESIAAGFRVIAAMWQLESEQGAEQEVVAATEPATIEPKDNPASGAGQDLVDTATGAGLEGAQ